MNKKVEIITLHRIVNYGSVLQAYATQQTLIKLGYDVEFIDYYPERMHILGMLKRIKNKKDIFKKNFFARTLARIIIFPSYLKRFHTFKTFLKKYINLTSKTYNSLESLIEDYPKADIYCTGSDQVWNSEWNEKVDRVFFLDFLDKGAKKIAYAASFGKKRLDPSEKEITKQLLGKYDKISLRENSGVEILEDLGLHNSVNVLDPTLLLYSNDWIKLCSNKYEKDNYILVYNLNRNKKIDIFAENLSKKTGLEVKFLSYQFYEIYKKGKMYCNPRVEDFLALIKNAKYIITDSFHGTAFSLNFNKEFVIVYPEKFSTRLQSILEILNLKDRVAKNESDIDVINKKINYNIVNLLLDEEREKSIKWLKQALEEEE